MKHTKKGVVIGALFAVLAGAIISTIGANISFAHCDTMSGPIIPEARAALEKGEITPVLKWIKPENEAEVKAAFAQAVQVRLKGPEAKELADKYFLETLIRLHRAGEGAPYTGIDSKPAEPIVAMADKALQEGAADEMIREMSGHMGEAINEKFKKALLAGKNKDKDIQAGRAFVEAYVQYMHYVEGIHAAILSAGDPHGETTKGSKEHKQ